MVQSWLVRHVLFLSSDVGVEVLPPLFGYLARQCLDTKGCAVETLYVCCVVNCMMQKGAAKCSLGWQLAAVWGPDQLKMASHPAYGWL